MVAEKREKKSLPSKTTEIARLLIKLHKNDESTPPQCALHLRPMWVTLSVRALASRGFSPGTRVFPSLQKLTFLS